MSKFAVLATLATFVVTGGPGLAVPVPPERPAKWEYAELVVRSTRTGFRAPTPQGQADQPEQPAPAAPMVRWITSADELQAKDWSDLAEKLKAPPAKKGAPAASERLRVLDHLGSEGWELVGKESSTGAATTYLFKRRVP